VYNEENLIFLIKWRYVMARRKKRVSVKTHTRTTGNGSGGKSKSTVKRHIRNK